MQFVFKLHVSLNLIYFDKSHGICIEMLGIPKYIYG